MIFQLLSLNLIAIIFSFIIAFPIIDLLYRFKITRRGESDFSNLIEKRKEKVGVPVMGGLMIVISIVIVNLLFNNSPSVIVLLFLFVLSALLGAFDDVLNIYGTKRKVRTLSKIRKLIKVHARRIVRLRLIILYPWHMYSRFFFMLGSNPGKGIQAHEKILIQAIVGILLSVWLLATKATTELWIPLLGQINIGILMPVFVVLTVMLMSNAVNIADGLDGLSSLQLFSSFFGFMVIAYFQDRWDMVILISVILGSLITYIYFNIPPARVQMGDVGSLSLGTLLAGVAFELDVPMLLLIISFPFAATLTSTVIQGLGRRVLGIRIFKMAPLHHHFEMMGWSESKVVMRFALFSAVCAILGLWIYFFDIINF